MDGYCLFEYSNVEINAKAENMEFLFAFQMKKQSELMPFARVICLDGTHETNHYSYYLFTLII